MEHIYSVNEELVLLTNRVRFALGVSGLVLFHCISLETLLLDMSEGVCCFFNPGCHAKLAMTS